MKTFQQLREPWVGAEAVEPRLPELGQTAYPFHIGLLESLERPVSQAQALINAGQPHRIDESRPLFFLETREQSPRLGSVAREGIGPSKMKPVSADLRRERDGPLELI